MGIHNLNKLLKKHCPDIFETIHLSEYAYKKVAVDVSLFLCKFKTVCGEERWLSAFINLVVCLRTNNIHCIFIYDTGAPKEKIEERDRRAVKNNDADHKVFELEDAVEHYHNTNEVRQILIDFNQKKRLKSPPSRLLSKQREGSINIKAVEVEIARLRKQVLSISKDDFILTKKLFESMGVPYYQAVLEAETSCADLCKRGLVDAVLTEDTDVLAYGCPVFLSKISTVDGTCVRIKYDDMINKLDLSSESFTDLCIMCGCDYNKNIPKIGPENAYKLLKTHKSIETIATTGIDVSALNHVRSRELFTQYGLLSINPGYCMYPDYDKLTEIMQTNNINLSMERIKKAFEPELLFEE